MQSKVYKKTNVYTTEFSETVVAIWQLWAHRVIKFTTLIEQERTSLIFPIVL